MSKKFIIIISPDDKEVSDKVLTYVKDKGFSWWHWINGTYLIKSKKSEITCRQMRDDLRAILPATLHLVIELKPGTDMSWCGTGPTSKGKSMFDWLHKNWKSE